MKRVSAIIGVGIILLLGILSVMYQPQSATAKPPSMVDKAPPLTPDPNRILQPVVAPTTPPLPNPLTENEALERAIYFDTISGVVWEEPWSAETIVNNPERIKINLYNTLSEADKANGRDVGYSDDWEKDAGQVWVVSIQGLADISLAVPHVEEGMLVDWVSYQISARTGVLLGMSTGPFVERK